jgi:hypothetical protein
MGLFSATLVAPAIASLAAIDPSAQPLRRAASVAGCFSSKGRN